MSAVIRKIVLKTPAAVGSTGQYSALELCRNHATEAADASDAAQHAQTLAQSSSSVAVAARDAALATVGAVKVTAADAQAGVLDASLEVAAPLAKTVLSPGGDEALQISVADLSGATGTSPGTSGVVPAPQTGDQNRFLRGDATWQTLDRANLGLSGVVDEWTALNGAVTRLSDSQAAVPGNQTNVALPGGVTGRAIRPDLPAGVYGTVADAVYDAPGDRTVITLDGISLAAECTALYAGQDPRNAPASSSAGSDLYLASIYNCFLY